jgi:molybdate transport system ATP-binding protein
MISGRPGKPSIFRIQWKQNHKPSSFVPACAQSNNLAKRFADYIRSKPARAIMTKYGFVLPARALAANPHVLLMDEPLAGLDNQRKREILPYLTRLHDELEIPVLCVTHSGDEVAQLADHIVVMENGRALAHGPLAATLARLDLPIRLGEDAGVVLEGTVIEIDTAWQLACIDVGGERIWTPDRGVPVGTRTRLRVLARDVSIALHKPSDNSIQNVLHGTVDELAEDGSHPGLVLVRVQAGHAAVLARLTRRAAVDLALERGKPVWVQIKSVALMK